MIPNSYRFAMDDDYDRIKVKCPPKVRKFQTQASRQSDITLLQAGDITKTDILQKGKQVEEFYKTE